MSSRYNEDKFLEEVYKYIKGTYDEHYVSSNKNGFQLIDIWAERGTALTSSIDIAIKYLYRYGRKGGYNKKDLLKAIHYICFADYFTPKQEEDDIEGVKS